jgi:hypothetical protein
LPQRVEEHGLGHLGPQPGWAQVQDELLVAPGQLGPTEAVEIAELLMAACLHQRRLTPHPVCGLRRRGAGVSRVRARRAGQPADRHEEVELRVAAAQTQRGHVGRHGGHLGRLEAAESDARLGVRLPDLLHPLAPLPLPHAPVLLLNRVTAARDRR